MVDSPDPEVWNVSDTALFVAHSRAVEGTPPDALFHDPLAARLAGERGRRIGERMSKALMGGWSIAIRTVIIDGYITHRRRDAVPDQRAGRGARRRATADGRRLLDRGLLRAGIRSWSPASSSAGSR